MRYKRNQRNILLLTLLIFGVMSFFGSASAMKFYPGENTTIDCDISLTYAAAWRAKDPEKAKLGKFNPLAINSDDGNENFEQYDMINNKATVMADIDIQHKNFGLFLRPKAFYDYVYMTDNANDSPLTNNNLAAGVINETDEFDDETEDAHGRDAELLDIFAYTNFDLAGCNVELRVGRQVISWGESLYISGGIASAQTYVDLTAANSPGVELKEIYLPTEAVSLQMDLTDNLAFAAYYQWKWHKHRLDESGAYFSTTDMLDEAGYALFVPVGPVVIPLPRGNDDEAKDDGQYGVALTFMTNWMNSTEFGLYYINYHEKAPMLKFDWVNLNYFLDYAEDIKLYGFSFSSQVGDANVSGEISYRKDYMFATGTPGVYEKGDVIQAQVSGIYYAGPTPIYSDLSIVGEVGFNQAKSIDRDILKYDKFAWGFRITLTPKWYQIMQDLDLSVPISYTGNPSNTSTYGGFTDGADSGLIGMDFTYKNVYIVNLKYVDYFNSKRNSKSDRDFFSVNFKYTF